MKDQKIQSTTDYGRFGSITSNREVDKKHVKRLAAAIEKNNLLHLNPIIVNSAMQVIDGQHRLSAARFLKVPIYYVQDDAVKKDHIAALNTNMKNWSTMDYVNYWTSEKKPGFKELAKFVNKYGLPVTGAVVLLAENLEGGLLKDLKEGQVDVSNLEQATEIMDFVETIRDRYAYNWVINGGLVKALRKMWDHPDFDPNTLDAKIAADPRKLVPCTSDKTYLVMLSDIYNWRLQYRVDFFTRRRRKEDEA